MPKVDSDEELIRIVDEVIAYIKSTGLNHYVGPCETSVEGDYEELMESLRTKVLTLPPDTTVYPGHGPATTIATELTTNPFLVDAQPQIWQQ